MMVRAVSDIEQSRCPRTKLESKGDLYLHNMFHVAAKRTTWRQIETGAITDYLTNQIERDQKVKGALINEFSTPKETS